MPTRREEWVVIQKSQRNLAFQTQHIIAVGKEVL
jgi:hypothetical protein